MDAQAVLKANEISSVVPNIPETEKSPATEIDLSSKFAALTRKEKMLMEREKAFKNQYEPMERELGEYKSFKQLQEEAKVNSGALARMLEQAGIPWEKAVELMAQDPLPAKDPEVVTLKQKLEQMEKQNADKEIENKKKEEEQAIIQFKGDLLKKAESDPDKYELILIHGQSAIETAYEVMEEYYRENNELLALDKSLDYVENYLTKEAEKIAKARKLGFITSKDAQVSSQAKSLAPTLTNSTVISAPHEDLSRLSPDERMKAIVAKYSKK